jgi:hypothetical protein
MLRLWHVFADVKTAEDLDLAVPALKPQAAPDGTERPGPRTVVIPAGPEITGYLEQLAARAEKVRGRQVDPSEDNMLKISGDGRRAALDMRLVAGERALGECKLERAAQTIAGIWRENRERTYLDPDTGERSPTAGALQIVFCDLSTPSDTWNAYGELRALLETHGVPGRQVRFVHEARNDAEKGRLFASCRAGHIAVLVGSTEKMGVGTNIQPRAIALHHVDVPWRPADIEQREGRILRQGNQNPEVEIYRYVVERSFDAYSWQTVERKAKFIAQVTRGRLDVRAVDDIGDQALSYTEVKALASGDPLILDHARVSHEVTRLERLERAWGQNRQQLRYTLASAVEREKARARDVEAIDAAIAQRVDTRGDLFAFTVGAVTHRERKTAAEALLGWATSAALNRAAPVGQIGGFDVHGVVKIDYAGGGREAFLTLAGVPAEAAHAALTHLNETPLTLVRQVEHRITDLEGRRSRTIVGRHEAAQEAARAREGLQRPFKYSEQLQAKRAELVSITERMQAAAAAPAGEPAADDTTAAAAAPARSDMSRVDRAPKDIPPAAPPRPRRPARYPARPPRSPLPSAGDVHTYPPPGGVEL